MNGTPIEPGSDVSWAHDPHWRPAGVDLTRASAARMYDYYLGGAHNFAVDRQRAEEVLAVLPQARVFARQNRAFLRRAVRHMVASGIRQFLDLGAGLPSAGNVHQIAQALDPECRVVYVDNELTAVAHNRLLLTGNPHAVCVQADITTPSTVLEHPVTRRLLDFDHPVGMLLCAVLHFVPDTRDPAGVVAAYRRVLAAGSMLALSHATATDYPDQLAGVVRTYQATQNSAHLRTRAQVTGLVACFEHLLWPGVVYTPEWRPEHFADIGTPAESLSYALVATCI
ncbi:SAM-dependent methyltransferase [Kutzneria albida]|uniref:S-adenosyl methyltransferase n=1 Tax=Kutzneria albida DSM 43870 TaxID=1449976 RepID=W5WCD7_9PSEU|nr:SAM-dependent methyltransferase [Kutzneria albida]AHH98562.1 hypothetical protein KALB_5200 [Kutzneria albida DSM 43870]